MTSIKTDLNRSRYRAPRSSPGMVVFRGRSKLAVWLSAFSVVVAVLAVKPAPADAQLDDDIDSSANIEYVVDPDGGQVTVTIKLSLTADKPSRITEEYVTDYYFTDYYVMVPTAALELAVIDNGGSLTFIREADDEGFDLLDVNLRRNLFYRQTVTVTITYVMETGAFRSDSLVRINPAYAGFEVWDGTFSDKASITVVLPSGFQGNSGIGNKLRREEQAGEVIFQDSYAGGGWEASWSFVSVSRPAALDYSNFDVDDHRLVIGAWPGDGEWAAFVEEQLNEGIPTLIGMTGLDWPDDRTLRIIESHAPDVNGYAGWFDDEANMIEIGDRLDSHVIMHEVGHVWFNNELFNQRWIIEGLANEFAATVVESLGWEQHDLIRPSLYDQAAIPLAQWTIRSSDETELWAYDASWTVIRELTNEIGIDGMGQVILAADGDQIAYRGDGDPEVGALGRDWRYLLDLVEEVGGAEAASELFEEWVIPDASGELLDDREIARAAYDQLVSQGDGWAPPLAVRLTMSRWSFDKAEPLTTEAVTALDTRDRIQETASVLGLEIPDDYEIAYEEADNDLDVVNKDLLALEQVVETVKSGHEALAMDRSFTAKIGLIGADLDTRLAALNKSFNADQLDDVVNRTTELEMVLADAEGAGVMRLSIAAGSLVGTALVLAISVFVWRRRPRITAAEETDL